MKILNSTIAIVAMGALVSLTGCNVTQRLDAKFDTDPVGGAPPSAPSPTPPNDVFTWRTGFVTSTVVANTGGDHWVRVQPLPEFTTSPDDRRVFLMAVTEPFTTSPPANIRGSVRLRLDNPGTVGIGLRPLQGEQTLDYIGGIELSNFLPPSGGSVEGLQAFGSARFSDLIGLPSSGQISSYASGSVIDINWTIDQASRTFSASVLGGPSKSNSFPSVSGAVATTPIQRLILFVWMQKPTSNTVLFIDNVHAEEYR
jgi:hypothetical protein